VYGCGNRQQILDVSFLVEYRDSSKPARNDESEIYWTKCGGVETPLEMASHVRSRSMSRCLRAERVAQATVLHGSTPAGTMDSWSLKGGAAQLHTLQTETPKETTFTMYNLSLQSLDVCRVGLSMADNAPCLPYLFPFVLELRQSKNASNKIMELFQFLAYFGRRGQDVVHDLQKQVVREGASKSWYGILWKSFLYNFCIRCQ
jgi:hypothetical protein